MLCNLLVLSHLDFTNKEGRHIKTTRAIVSLLVSGEYFGSIELCSPLLNDMELYSVHTGIIEYDDSKNKNKFVLASLND